MASMTMTAASFLGSTAAATTAGGGSHRRQGVVVVKASSKVSQGVSLENENKEESSSGRRDLVFAAAAAAVWSVAGLAMADEPKKGTLEARKKYAPICVTMPTARIFFKYSTQLQLLLEGKVAKPIAVKLRIYTSVGCSRPLGARTVVMGHFHARRISHNIIFWSGDQVMFLNNFP